MDPSPDDESARAGQVAEGIQSPLRTALLNDCDCHDNEHEPEEHQSIARRSHDQIQAACGDEHQEHWLPYDLESDGEEPALLLRGQFVGSVLLKLPAGVLFAKAREPAQVKACAARFGNGLHNNLFGHAHLTTSAA